MTEAENLPWKPQQIRAVILLLWDFVLHKQETPILEYVVVRWTVDEATWGRMAVNLSKNGPALMAAYKEVVDSKTDTNWWAEQNHSSYIMVLSKYPAFILQLCVFRALFTYEGNHNDIRLADKGSKICHFFTHTAVTSNDLLGD